MVGAGAFDVTAGSGGRGEPNIIGGAGGAAPAAVDPAPPPAGRTAAVASRLLNATRIALVIALSVEFVFFVPLT